MKYILALAISIVAFMPDSSAQMFFDAGLKYNWGPTVLFNKNIFDDGDYDHQVTFGSGIGGKLGINFNGKNGINLEYLSATSKQDFEFQIEGFPQLSINNIEWKHNDFLLLYRFSGNGAYIEIGPKLSLMKSVEQDIGSSTTSPTTDYYVDNYLSGVFGFGSYLFGSDLATLQIGVRLHWGLDDLINDFGRVQNAPTVNSPLPYPTYEKTSATAAQLNLEFNYAFGRFAKAECSQRWKLVLFQ